MLIGMRAEPALLYDNRSGATAIEYALIAGLISIGIVAWAMSMGTTISTFFTEVGTSL